MRFRELALFAGAGGGILGGLLLGWRTVCAVEIDPYCRSVLLARQRDGMLQPFPIWDDVRTFDGNPWRGHVDVVSGGFPCQDISCAGKGDGIDGERSGLWSEFARIIREVRPRYAFVENSPMLVVRGLDRVLADLAAMGFNAEWEVVSAADVGAPHKRERIWIVANADGLAGHEWRAGDAAQGPGGRNADRGCELSGLCHAYGQGLAQRKGQPGDHGAEFAPTIRADWWESEPDVGRVAYGVANRVDRLKALGNGQVPRVAAAAWRILSGRLQ